MNTVNRVVLVILLLAVMVMCSFVLVLPVETLQTVGQLSRELADEIARIRPVARLPVGILLALIVNVVALVLIILEGGRRAPTSIKVEQVTGGEATLAVSSIADQLKVEVKQLPGVMQAKPRVSARRKGVVIEIDAKIAAQTGVRGEAEKIVETARRVVEEKMGLKLARPPKVNIEAVRPPRGEEPTENAATSPEEWS